jgi:Zn-dependent protease with chaperone function
MLNKLKKLIEEAKKRAVNSVDPEVFNHPLAQKTEWHPLKGGGTNFGTHRLDSSDQDLLVFKATKGAYVFSGIFTFIGVLGLVIPILAFIGMENKEWGLLLFGIFFGGVFLTAGLLLFKFMTQPCVFDTFYGCFYKGKKRPQDHIGMDRNSKNPMVKLSDVKAIQVIRERISSKNGSYYSYEINLVLADASRVNVIDHGKHSAIIEDAEILATALGVPLWDGS